MLVLGVTVAVCSPVLRYLPTYMWLSPVVRLGWTCGLIQLMVYIKHCSRGLMRIGRVLTLQVAPFSLSVVSKEWVLVNSNTQQDFPTVCV